VNSQGIVLTAGFENQRSTLIQQLSDAKTAMARYQDTNADLTAFYTKEVTRITDELKDEGLWDFTNNQPEYAQVFTVDVAPIRAQAGVIDVRADQLQGNGTLDAPG